MTQRSYGSKGRVGIGTPQSNPTVEPEIALLLPSGVAMYTSRLISKSPDARTRTLQYFERMSDYLDNFAVLEIDAFGFGCTGSTYLAGIEAEQDKIESLEKKYGYPIFTATSAIRRVLDKISAKRLAIIGPYPDWLTDAGHAYWESAGYTIANKANVEIESSDTLPIYDLEAEAALNAAKDFNLDGCDCLLFTGTGMATLYSIGEVQKIHDVPVISSNMCLAWALLDRLGIDLSDTPLSDESLRHPLINGWQDRLAAN